MLDRIQWLGHGSFMIQGPPLIYINPWRVVRSAFLADIILVGHDHYEHCSPADIQKLRGEGTKIITNAVVADQIQDCIVLRPMQSITIDQVSIKAIPAYSLSGMHHPREAGGLGFIISMNFYDIYYAGDTQLIPEMELLKPDVAILPIDGNGTLNVSEAAQLTRRMGPRWVIPSNWGSSGTSASYQDVQRFKELVGNSSEVIIYTR